MKLLKIGLGLAFILCLAAVAVFYGFFKGAVPEYDGTLAVAGLGEPVTVKTDDFGIPHIIAKNQKDLFFAQGYIMARERLFQMDMTRLAGRGELSTFFGERTLGKDRFLRTVGFYRKAKASYPQLPPETQEIIQAFVAGVNAYIKSADPLPREYFFLGVKPQPWTPEDTVVIDTLMAYSLTRSKKIDLVMHMIRQRGGEKLFNEMLPHYPDMGPVLVGGGKPAKPATGPRSDLPKSTSGGVQIGFGDDFPLGLDLAASNWMVFSGKLTDTGKPMFAGSPDLAPTLPALFYLMHIKGGGIDAMGGTLVGTPGLGPLGYNGHVVFSAVNGRGDELDYFIEKINPDNPDQYLTEDGYRDFEVINDEIKIKTDDGFKTEKLTIRISRHGPMISDVLPGAPADCAMQWSALDLPATDLDGLLKALTAKDIHQFRQALSGVRTINLGIGMADNDGNIGWQFLAAPPIRKKGIGSAPVPGWTGEYDWTGFVPFDRLPYDINPKSGYAASFNNEPGNISYYLTNYYLYERALRFKRIMDQRPKGQKVTFAELKQMQLDTGSVPAERWVPLALKACGDDPKFATAVTLLKDWDYKVKMDSSAATLFNYFYYLMMGNTLKDDVGEEIWLEHLRHEYLYYVPDEVLTRIYQQPKHYLFDDTTTKDVKETRDDIIRRSMAEALEYLTQKLGPDTANWKWGGVHKMRFDHPLGSKLSFLNLKPVPTHGSHHTINSGFWKTEKPFEMCSGGVIRIMIDFADMNKSTIISPPGQSGHYLSPYYDDLVRTWAAGDQVPMHYDDSQNLPQTLTLKPAQ